MLSKARDSQKPSILWCYNKELGFQGDNQARMRQFKSMAKKRQESVIKNQDIRKKKQRLEVLQKEMEQLMSDPFHLFLSCTDVKYSYYRETHKVLGNTYGMLILQDFEGITPNILARTIETVEGSGMVILLLPDLNSLSQLYEMAMDIHSKFVSSGVESDVNHERPKGRFNERFLLSLATCKNAIVMDDELNVLPLSSHITSIIPLERQEDQKVGSKGAFVSERQQDLNKLVQQLADAPPLGPIASLSRTMDQCEALVQFVEAISEKTLQTTVALTAARGRGKSATLGLSMAAAVAYGYSNIFVTAPSPENLHTLFEFVCRGFNALGMKDTVDYEVVKSTHNDTKGAVIRINIFREHRQTIQYIHPEDAAKLGQAELVVIDEAAAIPLPIVRKLFGPYLVFISSTVNGYEGTGRSLSLKLIEELKNRYSSAAGGGVSSKFSLGRKFHELTLDEPIRYARNDPVESWLYKLLCLDATSPPTVLRAPHPDDCKLYYVNRDTLFSFHAASEKFLHNMMSLFVSSHYKNSPNDLQLLSDAPDQHIFVLLGPIDENSTSLPDIFCVVQLGFEGKIRKDIVQQYFQHGKAPSGDLIPYVISRQFQEVEFSGLSGARIVRVATHPQWQKMGYGSKALNELEKYFKKELISMDDDSEEEDDSDRDVDKDDEQHSGSSRKTSRADERSNPLLRTEIIKPRDRTQLPPLLQELTERTPEDLDYLGVSFGLTDSLYRFWMRAHFEPVYIRLSKNSLTGEHSSIMLRGLKNSSSWLTQFTSDFRRRFISLLSYDFKTFPLGVVLSILQFDPKHVSTDKPLTVQEFDTAFSPFDFKRLVAYSKDMVDYHVVMDLIPILCKWFFDKRTDFTLNIQQASILVGLGLQHRSISAICEELNKPSNQLLALFNKSIRKFVRFLTELSKNRYVEERQLTDERVSTDKKQSKKLDKEDSVDADTIADEKQAKLDEIFGKESNKNKRKRETDADRERKTNKKQKIADASIVENILKQDDFKVSHVDVDALTKDETKKPRKIHKHMLKSQSELNRMKKAEKSKVYKKGGKKKRKVIS